MSKNTKQTTVRKSKNSKSILNKTGLSTKKKQVIAVIFIIAILSAGWFTYKSFACDAVCQSQQQQQTQESCIKLYETGGSSKSCPSSSSTSKSNSGPQRAKPAEKTQIR